MVRMTSCVAARSISGCDWQREKSELESIFRRDNLPQTTIFMCGVAHGRSFSIWVFYYLAHCCLPLCVSERQTSCSWTTGPGSTGQISCTTVPPCNTSMHVSAPYHDLPECRIQRAKNVNEERSEAPEFAQTFTEPTSMTLWNSKRPASLIPSWYARCVRDSM